MKTQNPAFTLCRIFQLFPDLSVTGVNTLFLQRANWK